MLKVVQIIPDERDVWGCDEPVPRFGPAPTALLEGFSAFPDEIEVHVVSCIRSKLPAPRALGDNIFYHAVPVCGGYRRTLFAEAARKVREKIQQIDPDVVHGQGTEMYAGVCAAFSGVLNCITIHGNMRAVARRLKYRPFPQMGITALAESVALRKTDAVICNSSYTEQCVGRLNKNKVRIPNAVRSSFFELRSKKTEESAKPILLCIGDILPYKNQVGLIDALDLFPDIGNIRLVFAGRCDHESTYGRGFRQAVEDRAWCEYAGALSLKDLQEILSDCAGVIHPTLEESFGLAVAEAQAAGVPVAASSVGGLPNLICEGATGWLFDPKSSEEICRAVSLLIDAQVAVSVSRAASEFARREYLPERIAEQHLRMYRSLKGDYECFAA